MHDQSPTILSSISKLEDGLKTYGLLKSIREQPLIWEPVFVSGNAHNLTATAFLNELLVDFSLSDVKKQKEIDVFYHFTNIRVWLYAHTRMVIRTYAHGYTHIRV